MSEESAVKVCVRVRPLIKREEAASSESAEPVKLYWKADRQAIHQIDDDGNLTKAFAFDRVFSAEESTNQLYQDIAKPLVVSTVEGYNGTIFTYGQTSSGKTFTMMGSDHIPGVIPLAMTDVFQTIKNCPKKEFLLRVSYMEIYNETVTDLLCESWKRKPLEIREGNYKNVYVADLTEELVTSPEQALAWIRKGEKNRHYGKTKMNQRSSRSHTIFRMILESRERSDPASGENADGAIIVSHLNLVDLAGSERASQTGAEGARFKEGCNINRSLFILGQVIKKLTDESQKGFINYRDSKLTRILQNSLGGNAKTVIICTITPVTVDETLSTLQFASAAKRMKNDPHVTEVSDDGALLRRYRNEIVDLKRRLQEVSSVTQTTVTEKETLCQLLQEKDQLQREQADRIRNLTKLLVTASNVVQVQKVPKRRMTWGGKLLRSAQLVAEDDGSADISYAEPFFKKRRADLTINEEAEDIDDFERFYTTTEDSSIDMEMNQSNITMRSYAEGMSPDSPHLMYKVECLERQLETETQGKQKAEEKRLAMEQKMEELEKQLQTLEQKLEIEVQGKQKAEEKCSELELKVTELEKPPEQETTNSACENCKYIGETIQLCETMSFEREAMATERDMLKQTLELLTEHIEKLKQENEALSKDKEALVKDKEALLRDIKEQKDADEFERLEEESKKDYERELEGEISTLKQASINAEDLVQKLKADLEAMSVQLKKKEDLVAELQTMSGKDLVQEVTRLRRSLDDAEGLSLETKKEWAFLRSENLSLKERDVNLTAEYDRMGSEVKALQSQLDHEKSRFKKMQADLQKELLGAFDENTKLTALLDGKVPKNILDSFMLEKTVADLRKELEKSMGNERALQNQVEEMKALEVLPAKVDDLLRQVCELNGELHSVQEERDSLVSAQASSTEENTRLKEETETAQEEIVKLGGVLADAELKEAQLSQQNKDTLEQLAVIQTDLEHLSKENARLLSALEETSQKSGQLTEELESLRCEREGYLSEQTEEVRNCQKELQSLRLVVVTTTEERDQLQEMLQTLKEERDQLKSDMEENVEMMIENQEELRTTLEKVKVQQDRILQLEAQTSELESKLSNSDGDESRLIEDLQNQVKQLKEELQSAYAEREHILSEKPLNLEELQRMQANISSLTEERDQLQEIMHGLREEKTQLKRDLEEKDEMIICFQAELNKGHLSDSEQQLSNLSCNITEEKEAQLQQIQDLKKESEELAQENAHLKTELQEISQKLDEFTTALQAVQEERDSLFTAKNTSTEELKSLKEELEKTREDLLKMESELVDSQLKEAQLSEQQTENAEQLAKAKTELEHFSAENNKLLTCLEEANLKSVQLSETLESLRCEREQLLSEKQQEAPHNPEEVQNLLETVKSITVERNQLQEFLEHLREQHSQLKRDLEESNDLLVQAQDQLKQNELVSDQAATCVQDQLQQEPQLQERLEALTEENRQLKTDLQENVEMMIENQAELRAALDDVKELQDKVQDLESQRDHLESKLPNSDDHDENKLEDLKVQIKQLNDELKAVRDEKDNLSGNTKNKVDIAELEVQANVTSLTEEQDQLLAQLQGLKEEQSQLKNNLEEKDVLIVQLREELQSTSAERDELLCPRTKDCVEDIGLEMVQANVTALSEERDQLLEILQGLREEKNQMKSDLEEKDEMMMQLKNEVQSVTAEKDRLLDENTKNDQDDLQELERLQASVSSLTEERGQLLEVLQGLREEKNQLRIDLERKDEMLMQQSEALQTASSAKDHLLVDKAELEECQVNILALTEERDQVQEENKQLKMELEEKNEMMRQLREELQSLTAEKDCLLSEKTEISLTNTTEIEQVQAAIASITEERDQLLEVLQGLREEKIQLRAELEDQNDMMMQLKHEVQSMTAEKDCLLDENTKNNQENLQEQEKLQASVLTLTEERDQLLEVLQGLMEEKNQLRVELEKKDEMMTQLREVVKCTTAEKDHLLAEKAESCLSNKSELEKLQASVLSLTEERDQLLEMLQGLREEKSKLKVHLEEKDEMIQQLKQVQATERDHLLMKDASCSISSSNSSSSLNEEGGHLQELLQGVRELLQVQGELKQQKHNGSEQPSPGDVQEAQLQRMQALKEEMESLRNERTMLRKDLQEAAEMSKAYQDLLHSTKEELKQQQNKNVDLMTQSAEKESQLKQQLSQLSEDLLSLRGLNDQLLAEKSSETQNVNTQLQSLRTRITSLEEEKEKLDGLLKESEEKRRQLAEEVDCLGGIKDQLMNEKTHADQLLEVLNGVREERNQLSQELQEKVEELSHIEDQVQGLEKQKMLLEAEVSTLNQSLQEVNSTVSNMNEEADVASKRKTLMLVSEMETSNEKLKAAFMKLQRIIDRPTPQDPLADDSSKQWPLFCQLVALVPKSQRAVYNNLAVKTNLLNSILGKTGVTLKTIAQRHKAHFVAQVQRDVASFEERRLQDVLIRRAQAPSRSIQIVQEDLQEIWDQRLLELLEKRKQCLQDMNSILEVLEEGVAKHAVTLSEEHQARTCASEESRALARSTDEGAVMQFFERELVRRAALLDRQKALRQHLLDKYYSAVLVLKTSENESEQRLREEQRENFALLPGQNTDLPKTMADLLQDKQHLSFQLQQSQKQMEVIAKRMEELKVQGDASNQKHLVMLQELSSNLKEKVDIIEKLQGKLKESEALAKTKMPPSAAEMEAMKDKLVKMELDHIAETAGHEKEIAQLTSVLEHREEVIRKLKETLRKTQQEEEHSFVEGEQSHSKPVSQTKAVSFLKEKQIEDLEKKNAHFESLVTKQQEEITKWKSRAYKLRESKKEAPQSPRTPTKRQPPLVESEVNSPKRLFIDSPKSKFFDVRSGADPLSLKCPKQFFDNSNLGTMPDTGSSAAVSSSANSDSWWNLPNSSPRKANANADANGCPTQ
ncbi:centromere-associated protein E [Salminus brasiliensis]|uniref:centromere-associated protein E n=1 Tax=Salminus brasiliensis TaxID=930266 RepID=UPI003B837360